MIKWANLGRASGENRHIDLKQWKNQNGKINRDARAITQNKTKKERYKINTKMVPQKGIQLHD